MRFAVHFTIGTLVIACACAIELHPQVGLVTLYAQPAPFQHSAAAEPQNNPAMTSIAYKEDQGDVHGRIELQSVATERRLIISSRRDNGEPVTLQDQANLIDILLARILHDHPDLVDMGVMFGEGRGSFIPPLNVFLVQSLEWNSRTGLPRHSRLGDFLVQVFNTQGILEPLQGAFKRNGFDFRLNGVNRIDIQKMPSVKSAHLPKYTDVMYFSSKE